MQLELFDWRYEDTQEFAAALTEGQKKPWALTIYPNILPDSLGRTTQVGIDIVAPDGSRRHVWLEVDKGVLKAHCYDHKHEEPAVTVFLAKEETYVRGGRYEHVYRVQRDSATIAFARAPIGFVPENPDP